VIISLVTHHPQPPEYYKALLKDFRKLSHITVEVTRCPEETCNSLIEKAAASSPNPT
jgi:hypothetical protein